MSFFQQDSESKNILTSSSTTNSNSDNDDQSITRLLKNIELNTNMNQDILTKQGENTEPKPTHKKNLSSCASTLNTVF